jgi:uncharacterized protein (TIGR00369 family)
MDITQELMDRLNDNPLYNTIGIRIEEACDGLARACLEPKPDLCWPFPGQPHGGVLFTLMDTTMAWAVFSQLEPGFNCATVNLDIQYTHPAKGDLFTCSARTTHRTGRVSFVRAEIYDNSERLLAMGQANFRVVKMDITAAVL